MKLALVGDSKRAMPVLDAIARGGRHVITHAALVSGDSEVFRKHSVTPVANWEDLLTMEDVQAVLVAGDSEDILPAARQIASTGRPLIVVPSAAIGSAFAFELTLVRDENLVPLFPIIPHRFDGIVRRFAEVCSSGELGELVQLRFERKIAATDDGMLNPDIVEEWLLYDADLLRMVVGQYTQVTALYQGSTDSGFASSTINMAGDGVPDATWALNSGSPNWKLTAIGKNGQATVQHESGTSTLTHGEQTSSLDVDAEFAAQLDSQISLLEDSSTVKETNANWLDLTRAFEMVDGHRRSIKRRRTIDLYFETASERSQFKTQMAAGGCGVLMFTLFGLVAYLILAAAIAPTKPDTLASGAEMAEYENSKARFDTIMHICRIVWLLPVSLFMLAQFLLIFARPSATEDDENPKEEETNE